MSTDRDTARIVRSWLRTDEHESADRVLDAVLDRIDTTPQRRATWWPARRIPIVSNTVRIALAAAAVVVIAFLGIRFLVPGQNIGTQGPSPTPTATPVALSDGPLEAGTYVARPFAASDGGFAACPQPAGPGCDPAAAASVSFTFTVPDGWAGLLNFSTIWLAAETNSPPGGAGIVFVRGSWLASDPCAEAVPDIPVGPSVDDFASALADHPLLETTTPIDVTLGGHSGKYMDLQVPSALGGCSFYRPWDPGIYAQGPGHRWHLWILDVDGVRVVVQGTDYARTSPQHQTELQEIVDSIQIKP